MQLTKPWRAVKGGLVIAVRLTPKSSRDAVRGLESAPDGPRLAVTVRAVPDKGEANRALVSVVAGWLELPKSKVTLIGGGKSRSKSLKVEGDGAQISVLLENKLRSKD